MIYASNILNDVGARRIFLLKIILEKWIDVLFRSYFLSAACSKQLQLSDKIIL